MWSTSKKNCSVMDTPETFEYQAGGSLPLHFPGYVERAADQEIYYQLKAGQFCYVLTPRQMGKSSLRVRTMQRLMQEGYQCSFVDLTSIDSQQITADSWYFNLLYKLSGGISRELRKEFHTWWREHDEVTPVARMIEFLQRILLTSTDQPVVLFIDEIDSILSLDQELVNTDDFFAGIRALYNARVDNPDLNRLNLVVIGVATPRDLMQDIQRTPFNIGVPIQLSHFTLEEMQVLGPGLAHLPGNTKTLLAEVHHWTEGQPVLTQTLCRALAQHPEPTKELPTLVKAKVQQLFLNPESGPSDHNLSNVSNRLQNQPDYNVKMLSLYQQLVAGETLKMDNTSQAQLYLRLTGIVREEKGHLVIASPIYAHFFDSAWVTEALGRIERTLAQPLALWLESGKDHKRALQGSAFEDAYAWAQGRNDLLPQEKEFIEFSRKEKDRLARLRTRRITLATFVLSIATIVAIFFAISAYRQKQRADSETQRAIKYSNNLQQIDSLIYTFASKKIQGLDTLTSDSIVIKDQDTIQVEIIKNLIVGLNASTSTLADSISILRTDYENSLQQYIQESERLKTLLNYSKSERESLLSNQMDSINYFMDTLLDSLELYNSFKISNDSLINMLNDSLSNQFYMIDSISKEKILLQSKINYLRDSLMFINKSLDISIDSIE
ncbi:MAG TPA: hypothetical protein DCR93_07820 [Cytophagales bacterium]|nr:hypothetical protein [Cytophagales bacterium]HAP59397.1 hypothetical protein [Cytophagales bacterium]